VSARAKWVAVLALIVVLEVGWAMATHRGIGELESILEVGRSKDRVFALHVLTSRDVPRVFSNRHTRALLESDDVLVREWVLSPTFRAAATGDSAADAYVAALSDTAEGRRARFLHGHDRVRGQWMTLEEFRGFLADRD